MRRARRLLGHRSIWGKEGILPPASGSSSQWSARVFSALLRLSFTCALWLRCLCLRSPPSHNPLPRFQNSACVASLPLLKFCIAIERRRSSVSPERPIENARGANANALAPESARTRADSPTQRAQIPPSQNASNETAGLPRLHETTNAIRALLFRVSLTRAGGSVYD